MHNKQEFYDANRIQAKYSVLLKNGGYNIGTIIVKLDGKVIAKMQAGYHTGGYGKEAREYVKKYIANI